MNNDNAPDDDYARALREANAKAVVRAEREAHAALARRLDVFSGSADDALAIAKAGVPEWKG
jgi:hypothetical protein